MKFMFVILSVLIAALSLLPCAKAESPKYIQLWSGNAVDGWLPNVAQIDKGDQIDVRVVAEISGPTGSYVDLTVYGYDKFDNATSEDMRVTSGAGLSQSTQRYTALGSGSKDNPDRRLRVIWRSTSGIVLTVSYELSSAAGGPTEPDWIPLTLPNIPLLIKQLLERIQQMIQENKKVLGLAIIAVLVAVIAKASEKKKVQLPNWT